jgi:hypothetical protein
MDSSTYVVISGFLFLLRIGITIFCVDKARSLNRSQIGWGIFGFVLSIVALIWILFLKPLKVNEKILRNQTKTIEYKEKQIEITEKYKLLFKEILSQEQQLQDLRHQSLLTEEEYMSKINGLNNKKKEFTLKQEEESLAQEIEKVKALVHIQIKPTIIKLDNLLKTEVLTQEEYDQKSALLFNEKYNSIFKMPYLNPNYPLKLEKLKYSDLKENYKRETINAFHNFNIGNAILLSKTTKKLVKVSSEEFHELNNSEEKSNYTYIEIPDFLKRLGYHELQKKNN